GETARRVRAALEREPELRRQALELGRMFPPGTRIKAFGRMCTAGSFRVHRVPGFQVVLTLDADHGSGHTAGAVTWEDMMLYNRPQLSLF
ncbi:MAG: hypothetical protein NW241_10795, partial [Bacteroidia bacterium]|nr:hypothetical protein [Bacteroidia bacterium]